MGAEKRIMLQSLSLDGAGLFIEHRRCDRPRPIGWAAARISQVTVLGLSSQSQRCFGRPRSAFSAATIAESLRAAAARAFGGRSNHAGPLLGVWDSRGRFHRLGCARRPGSSRSPKQLLSLAAMTPRAVVAQRAESLACRLGLDLPLSSLSFSPLRSVESERYLFVDSVLLMFLQIPDPDLYMASAYENLNRSWVIGIKPDPSNPRGLSTEGRNT
ncbi:hypothetical protein CISG_01654 [Coccidioides immitis RMSCC 3703]|nr:hypothetical protein CIRG_08293 [Coccidioides immitis RMSCC 2394]KMU78614.1 hypothetical protein CISG_01654 [Coccidioides immitis RMSCC 3703]